MDNIYENSNFSKRAGSENCLSLTEPEPETEDDVYMNTQEPCPKPKACAASSYKITISALGLLILVALTSLCAVGVLYHKNIVSFKTLSEKYENATATLVELEYKAKETERLYKELQVKHHELVSARSETEQQCKMLKVKYQRDHERLSACSGNTNCQLCEEGWKSYGLKCYFFSTEKLNWTESRDSCVGKGGHLVIITSTTEQNYVSSQIDISHWIGLNDLETEGKWMWVNNQPLTETGVIFWHRAPAGQNEPDNWKVEDPSGENCAALGNEYVYSKKWFDASCQKQKQFICEE